MSDVSAAVERVVGCIVNKMNEVQTSNKAGLDAIGVEMEHAAYVMGALETEHMILNKTITDEFVKFHDKLNLVLEGLLIATDPPINVKFQAVNAKLKAVNAKLDALTKLIKLCFCVVMVMLCVCAMQNTDHMQWAVQVANVTCDTPNTPITPPVWVVNRRSDLHFMADLIFYMCTGMYITQ